MSTTAAPAVAPQRIIVGISGASGAIYGVRLLRRRLAHPAP